jgi:hypothetical protein
LIVLGGGRGRGASRKVQLIDKPTGLVLDERDLPAEGRPT